jgi:hypothetical protein
MIGQAGSFKAHLSGFIQETRLSTHTHTHKNNSSPP